MTWEPKNRTEDEDASLSDDERERERDMDDLRTTASSNNNNSNSTTTITTTTTTTSINNSNNNASITIGRPVIGEGGALLENRLNPLHCVPVGGNSNSSCGSSNSAAGMINVLKSSVSTIPPSQTASSASCRGLPTDLTLNPALTDLHNHHSKGKSIDIDKFIEINLICLVKMKLCC